MKYQLAPRGFMSHMSVVASNSIGVLIADSNHMQRQLLVSALRRRPEFLVNSCEVETDAIQSVIASSPVQVAVLTADHRHNGWPEMAIVRRLHLAHPAIAKILLLDSYDRDLVVNAFRSGAKGLFCVAEHPFRLFCRCIQSVHQGQIWANSEQLQYLIEGINQVPSLRVVNTGGLKLLTPRQEQVVALVAAGLSNREVAGELGLSEHTVKKYMFRIFDKLGVSSRVELALYAVSHGGTRPAEWMAGAGVAEATRPIRGTFPLGQLS